MPIKRNIPGQLREQEMQGIEILAGLVPAGGAIVEVGSLLGLSSWIWAKSADPTTTVYCIDPWEAGKGSNFVQLAHQNQQQFSKAQFVKNTSDCENVVALQGFSPQDFSDWHRKIDLYFEDAVHTDPIFSQNIEFWSSHLTPGGILCGHDYHRNFPDVQNGAQRYAKRMERALRTIGSLWYLLPQSIEDSLDETVVEKLSRLSILERFSEHLPPPRNEENLKEYSKRVVSNITDFRHCITLSPVPDAVAQGETITITGFVRNTTSEDWPVILMDTAVLRVGAELKSATGKKVDATRAFINRPVLSAGETIEFSIDLRTGSAPPGPTLVHIDLVYEHVMWFAAQGARSADVIIELHQR
ncbi:class I SAM-dependent methyltransferase [Ensifer sp. YR511]|uniref:class I SAM-dependent methyltransferase n=1 Tax=Ensifer sp. YR511 TaxID=1855294 RepID=UPI00115FDBFA|nr:class I SAM-dependent methyltransferase [Ensifer sp. YR511]